MAIKFYLYEINDAHEIHCNTNSTITEIAGAFDVGTMELEWNECKYALLPNTPFFIKDTDTNEVWNYIISEDNVEVVKKSNPVKYKHTLTLSQSIHKLNNVALRNTVFTQSHNYQSKYVKGCQFVGVIYYSELTDGGSSRKYERTEPEAIVDHSFNDNTFLINNFEIDLSDVSYLPKGSIKVSSILCTFEDYNYNTYRVDTQQAKLIDSNRIDSLRIRLCDSTSYDPLVSTTYIEFYLQTEDLYKEIPLTYNQLAWLRQRKFFIKLYKATINDLEPYVPTKMPASIPYSDTDLDLHSAPIVYGDINVELSLQTNGNSLWDVLDILNKQCKKAYNEDSFSDYYLMPQTNDADDKIAEHALLLQHTSAPELSFTGCDLYEAVAKTLSYIDSFPIMHEDGTLDFQYLNDLSEEVIEDLEMNDMKTTLNEKNFTNKLATYYQNAKKEHPIIYPRKNVFKGSTASKYGVPGKDDWYFEVDKPIDYIDSLYYLYYGTSAVDLPSISFDDPVNSHLADSQTRVVFHDVHLANYGSFTSSSDPNASLPISVDLVSVLFPDEIYALLNVGWATDSTLNQYNTLHYTRNSNRIFLGETDKITTQDTEQEIFRYAVKHATMFQYGYDYSNTESIFDGLMPAIEAKKRGKFNCVYHAVYDGKVAQESTSNKVEKETIVAQNNGSVELNRLGNNLQGMLARLGNEEKSVSLPITALKDKIKLGYHYYDELGNDWIVNQIQTTFTTREDKVVVNAIFTKNYNAMAQFTGLYQEKRFSTIDTKLVSKGYENINEFIYFTHDKDVISNLPASTKICFNDKGLDAIINKTFGVDSLISGNTTFDNVGIITSSSLATYMQPVVYGNGNQVCFEMGFNHPLLAGNYSQISPRLLGDAFETKAILYTERNGEEQTFSILAKFDNNSSSFTTINNYPSLNGSLSNLSGNTCFTLDSFDYYKKPNEIFHLNYSLCFLPYWKKTTNQEIGVNTYEYEEIYFGDKFINKNGIIPNTEYENGKQREFYLYVSNSEKYSIVDQNAVGTIVSGTFGITKSITQDSGSQSSGYACHGGLIVTIDGSPYIFSEDCVSWCIADTEGNIYIAVNRKENSTPIAMLLWFTSRFRKV